MSQNRASTTTPSPYHMTVAPRLGTIPLPSIEERDKPSLSYAFSRVAYGRRVCRHAPAEASYGEPVLHDGRHQLAQEGSNGTSSVWLARSLPSQTSSTSRLGGSSIRLHNYDDYFEFESNPKIHTYAPPTHYSTLSPADADVAAPLLPSAVASSSSRSSGGNGFQSVGSSSQTLILHTGLTTCILHDLRNAPSMAQFLPLQAPDSLKFATHSRPCSNSSASPSSAILSSSLSSSASVVTLPFPFSTPATYPKTGSLILSLGLFTSIIVDASCLSTGVTCGDILHELHGFLQLPLAKTELDALDVDTTRVQKWYRRRVRKMETLKNGSTVAESERDQEADEMRYIDTLMGKTEVLRIVMSDGRRGLCVVETRRSDEW